MLYLRMFLYLVFGALAGQGIILFDADSGTVSFNVEDIILVASGLAGYLGTFFASRVAKSRGGET